MLVLYPKRLNLNCIIVVVHMHVVVDYVFCHGTTEKLSSVRQREGWKQEAMKQDRIVTR